MSPSQRTSVPINYDGVANGSPCDDGARGDCGGAEGIVMMHMVTVVLTVVIMIVVISAVVLMTV
jgi:hypothetical protein